MTIRIARLEEVCEINPRAPKSISDDTLVSFLPMSAVSEDGYVAFEEPRTYGEVKRGYTYFERGDVLIAKITPCFENGKATSTDTIQNKLGFGSTEFHVVRPSTDLDPKYVFYLLWSKKFRTIGEKGMTGSAGQKRVPADLLKRLEIPLPPLAEQKRIAAILDKADQLRQKRRQAIALLDSLTQGIFLEMFGDLGISAEKWSRCLALCELAEIGSGITKGRKTNSTSMTKVPYLAVANVQDKALNLATIRSIEATPAEIEKYKLAANDLLLTEGGDPDKLGRGTLWREELPLAIHQNHIFRVRFTTPEIEPLYANWLLGSEYGKKYFLKSAKQTTGIASINKTQLSSFPVILPPIDLQRSFVRRAEAVSSQLSAHRAYLDSFDSVFFALQTSAFRGEIR
ncbi:restriction endonuclease subunit S [Rhizobium leguminosarum]|uniref:restriction endonuclease subunit S n=1 Tax=Rhizobium TaxID=379 RepID=UPI001ECE7DD4|nr:MULTISPECIES: restriction endonuclease subunit S [Rhizobium]MBY3052516.1 restriction endonuclease subunit S [Rhizobium laguerreae]MBY5673594.1 restriction endonuclease subunit S [Rhizobium leguminosarum]MBY5687242.1 restriction endonuclease subunit S [Rhizobium leguminosarum]